MLLPPARAVAHDPAAAAPAPAAPSGPAPPPYGLRRGWLPQRDDDYGGGGAFPELHAAQFPLGCGRKSAAPSRLASVQVSADGSLDYTALVKQGANAGRSVAATHAALLPRAHDLPDAALARPEEEAQAATLAATRAVIEARVTGTLAANQPKALPGRPAEPQFIKYTPAKQGPEYNSGASHRVVKMHVVAVDPLAPPKFVHKKVPRGPGSPPVPVMHSPPRPVSGAEAAEWKVPPCISNWKNAKGYTIPLDKRLAADGRGLADGSINDGFASLSEALYVAEGKAREAVETRAKIARELAARDKARKEEELRQLAVNARSARAGGGLPGLGGGGPAGGGAPAEHLPPPPPLPAGVARPRAVAAEAEALGEEGGGDGDGDGGREPVPAHESGAERSARLRRDEIREERRRERERERRLEARDAHGGKRSKVTRDRERDVSERVALGQAALGGAAAARPGEALFDQRLFNQDAGLEGGFGPDDGALAFDKPLWADRGGLYAPKAPGGRGEAEPGDGAPGAPGARTFRPDRGFAGAQQEAGGGGGGGGGAPARPPGPVRFEAPAPAEDDVFGLSSFFEASRGAQR